METIEKAMVNVLKNDIKKLVEEQKSLKNFRKTVNFRRKKKNGTFYSCIQTFGQ